MNLILVSHAKPDYCHEAVASVFAQTFADWRCILWDSGVLLDQGYFDRWQDDRLTIIRSPEEEIRTRRLNPAPFLFNETVRRGLLSETLTCYLCDDDVLYPGAFAAWTEFFQAHPAAQCCHASQDVGVVSGGRTILVGERLADRVRGSFEFDCQVDYGQFCVRASVLSEVFWPEDSAANHADGVFMERCAARFKVYHLPVKVGCNRRTPQSTYGPVTWAPS